MPQVTPLSIFLLSFSTLFPVLNPVGNALIINPYLANRPMAERQLAAFKIVFYAFVFGVVAVVAGSELLKLMGIALPTIQIAGGIVIARMGFNLLNHDPDQDRAKVPAAVATSLFYPLAFPVTLGPGSISVLITLSASSQDVGFALTAERMLTLILALAAVLAVSFVCYAYETVITNRMGDSGSVILNRLMSFLLFCIGVQMFISGLERTFPKLFS